MTRVAFHNVSKHYDRDTLALRDFSLTIAEGELVVLVGPSGCGKSTVLRLLAGLEHVTTGEILIGDKVVNQMTPQQRNVAMVFQNYALYPHMSVRGNLEFPLRMAHLPKHLMQEKVTRIAAMLDLTDLLERKPKQLSGGQRQRVAMGRALVRDPNVFLLDEPLSNLDAKLRSQIRADIAQLQRRLNETTLYVTHDQVEAITLGDRVAVMNAGKLQQVGTPDELYQQPQNTFVAQFIGNPGMNIFPSGLFETGTAGIQVDIGGRKLRLPPSSQGAENPVRQHIGRKIHVGIRPEAFSCSPETGRVGIETKILSLEFLGHESLVHFRLSETDETSPHSQLIARLSGKHHFAVGADQTLYIDPDAIRLFDENGCAIRAR